MNEYAAGDKRDLRLPECQRRLIRAVCRASDNVVVVLLAGSALDLGEDGQNARAVVQAWYPGSRGGDAVADLLLGRFSPSGRLPVTFYRGDQTLPDFEDYAMEGRTYRYLKEKPLYPFGYGLGFTSFVYSELKSDGYVPGKPLRLLVRVTNTGTMAGAESAQAYIHVEEKDLRTPNFQLCAIEKVELQPGESRIVELMIPDYWLRVVTEKGERVLPQGSITLYVGDHQPDERSYELTGTECLALKL